MKIAFQFVAVSTVLHGLSISLHMSDTPQLYRVMTTGYANKTQKNAAQSKRNDTKHNNLLSIWFDT
jgi:hypothetical protein